MTADYAELLTAAKFALQEGSDQTSYSDADDEIGIRSCCHVLFYKDHSDRCWVPKLRAAVANLKE